MPLLGSSANVSEVFEYRDALGRDGLEGSRHQPIPRRVSVEVPDASSRWPNHDGRAELLAGGGEILEYLMHAHGGMLEDPMVRRDLLTSSHSVRVSRRRWPVPAHVLIALPHDDHVLVNRMVLMEIKDSH